MNMPIANVDLYYVPEYCGREGVNFDLLSYQHACKFACHSEMYSNKYLVRICFYETYWFLEWEILLTWNTKYWMRTPRASALFPLHAFPSPPHPRFAPTALDTVSTNVDLSIAGADSTSFCRVEAMPFGTLPLLTTLNASVSALEGVWVGVVWGECRILADTISNPLLVRPIVWAADDCGGR